MQASVVEWLSLIAIGASLIGNVICVIGVLYIKSVVNPLRTTLIEHNRRLDRHHHETSNLWERTSDHGERLARLEA